MNLITRLLDLMSPFSVETVIRRHERDMKRLQAVADNRRAAAEAETSAAHACLKAARDHADEAVRAERIADRMKALVD
jgi:hypothetical protein